MAIDRIPGVGPQNSDIAAAVNAPSAATIASTVASSVPTLAQINTAVNTQTNNSAIATAVAGAVPTLAQITSTVQSNAGSPFGGTWTNVAVANPASVNFITVSSIGGYRFLKILVALSTVPANETLGVRFNGDSGFNYVHYWGNGTSGLSVRTAHTELLMGANPGFGGGFALDIFSANGTTHEKVININGAISAGISIGYGLYRSNSAITSFSLFNASGAGSFTGIIRVMGAN